MSKSPFDTAEDKIFPNVLPLAKLLIATASEKGATVEEFNLAADRAKRIMNSYVLESCVRKDFSYAEAIGDKL